MHYDLCLMIVPKRERERESLLAQKLNNFMQIEAKAMGHRKKIVKPVVSSGAPPQFHKLCLMLMVAYHTDHGRLMTYIHCTNTFLTAGWGMQSHLYFDPWIHFVISPCHKNNFNLKSPSTMNIIKYIYAVFTRLLSAFEQWLASEILSRTSMFRFFRNPGNDTYTTTATFCSS